MNAQMITIRAEKAIPEMGIEVNDLLVCHIVDVNDKLPIEALKESMIKINDKMVGFYKIEYLSRKPKKLEECV